jgi:glycosyltransferase involved in cell wall biosynthesis
MKTKILHYIPGFNFGGIESRLLDWYRNIDRTKISFDVIRLNSSVNQNTEEFLNLGGIFFSLKKLNFYTFFSFIFSVIRIIKKGNYNVLHVHNVHSGFFVLLIGRIFGIKTRIIHSRTTNFLPNENNLVMKKLLMKITPLFATDYFSCSINSAKWAYNNVNFRKNIIIKNGIDTINFLYDESKAQKKKSELKLSNFKIIGTVGRLSPQKNYEFLLYLFSKIDNDLNIHRLLIVGSGSDKAKILNTASKLGIKDKIILIDNVKDVWNYYMIMDVFIGTSFYEGFGTTAIEAQCSGTPTVISTGFPREVVLSKKLVRLSLKDDLNNWINAVNKMLLEKKDTKGPTIIKNNGYEAKDIADYLQNFYINQGGNYEKK